MIDFIKKFWDKQAIDHGQAASASWGDKYAVDLEVETIAKYIKEGDRVLDVGCANGHATFKQVEKQNITIIGVDYSETMIEQANIALKKHSYKNKTSFSVADIKKLPFQDECFDVTYTTRVLINLPNWEEQIQGIKECLRVTKRGGIVVLSEAFYEPLMLLNSLRQLKQLSPLVEHDFNRYIKKSSIEPYLNTNGLNWENVDFSSIYYLGSRFLREIVRKKNEKLSTSIKYPSYDKNPINEAFHSLEKEFDGGGFGIQQAYIIRK